jgi:hemerythrin HHE cation binding domain-containing protein
MQANRVTDVIRMDHVWFRSQFAALEQARGDTAALTSIWGVLSARLEVHAAAEETLFYPRLLKDDADSVDDTKDAIKDHNEIRDGISDAARYAIGEDAWWKAVKATDDANTEHMDEEEKGPLIEFDDAASSEEQAQLAASFAEFESEHAGARGITIEDKDPEEYVEENAPPGR